MFRVTASKSICRLKLPLCAGVFLALQKYAAAAARLANPAAPTIGPSDNGAHCSSAERKKKNVSGFLIVGFLSAS
jgi:hypothetical protein